MHLHGCSGYCLFICFLVFRLRVLCTIAIHVILRIWDAGCQRASAFSSLYIYHALRISLIPYLMLNLALASIHSHVFLCRAGSCKFSCCSGYDFTCSAGLDEALCTSQLLFCSFYCDPRDGVSPCSHPLALLFAIFQSP